MANFHSKLKDAYELLFEVETELIRKGSDIIPTIFIRCSCSQINYFGEPICFSCGKCLK